MLHVYEAPPEGALHLECVSPYKSSFALWQEKAGRLPPSFAESERMVAGTHLEPALASWAQHKWPDWKLRKVRRYLRHDDHPGWGASRDYEVIAAGHAPVEFKNVDYLVFRDKWKGEGEDLVPPLHINLQLQAQIGVGSRNCDHGWIVVCVGGNQLHRVRVPRHDATQDRIGKAVDMFWEGVTQQAVPNWLADEETVLRLSVLDVDDAAPPVDLSDNEAANRDARRFMRWKRHADFVEGQLSAMKARLLLGMTEATKAVTSDARIGCPVIHRAAKEIPARWQDAKTYRGGFIVRPRNDK
jgi:predicted phage-related endonuclease